MIENVNGLQQTDFPSYKAPERPSGGLTDFSKEDQAIISSQAKILYELDKYNAGEGNEIDLAMASVMGKLQVEASATVIKTKDEMMDSIMDIIE